MAKARNQFVEALAPDDQVELKKLLKPVSVSRGQVLTFEGKTVQFVYFPVNSVVSIMASVEVGKTLATALVGRDGMIAAAPALDSRVSLCRTEVVVAGETFLCEAEDFKRTVLSRPTLLSAVMRHEITLFAQASQNAACSSQHGIPAQLVRTLLRFRDLFDNLPLPLTQGQLAELLGVRRTSVTQAASELQEQGVLAYSRGRITIRQPLLMRRASCDCYFAIRRHYSALLRIAYNE